MPSIVYWDPLCAQVSGGDDGDGDAELEAEPATVEVTMHAVDSERLQLLRLCSGWPDIACVPAAWSCSVMPCAASGSAVLDQTCRAAGSFCQLLPSAHIGPGLGCGSDSFSCLCWCAVAKERREHAQQRRHAEAEMRAERDEVL